MIKDKKEKKRKTLAGEIVQNELYWLGIDRSLIKLDKKQTETLRWAPTKNLLEAAAISTFGFNVSPYSPVTQNEDKALWWLVGLLAERDKENCAVPSTYACLNTTQLINPPNWILFFVHFIELKIFTLCNRAIYRLDNIAKQGPIAANNKGETATINSTIGKNRNAYSPLKRWSVKAAQALLQGIKLITGLICAVIKSPLRIAKLVLTPITGIIGFVVYLSKLAYKKFQQRRRSEEKTVTSTTNDTTEDTAAASDKTKVTTPAKREFTNSTALSITPLSQQTQEIFTMYTTEGEGEGEGEGEREGDTRVRRNLLPILNQSSRSTLIGKITKIQNEINAMQASQALVSKENLEEILKSLTVLHQMIRHEKAVKSKNVEKNLDSALEEEWSTIINSYKELKKQWISLQSRFIQDNPTILASYAQTMETLCNQPVPNPCVQAEPLPEEEKHVEKHQKLRAAITQCSDAANKNASGDISAQLAQCLWQTAQKQSKVTQTPAMTLQLNTHPE